jgi:hypothetical protein
MLTTPESLAVTLRTVACETLENLAFTEVAPKPATELREAEGAYLGAKVSLGGLGTMHLFIARELLLEIAEVLYSPGPEGVDESFLPDTLSEILNIIGGRFLEVIHQGKADFGMGLPVRVTDVKPWSRLPVRWLLAAEGNKELGVGIDPDAQ